MGSQQSTANQSISFKRDRGLFYLTVVERICALPWSTLTESELLRVAWAYYYFSIQFRENLEIACRLHPDDADLKTLHIEECNTANLSPWPDVAAPGEKLDHDAFMARLLKLQPADDLEDLKAAGEQYLASTRAVDELARAKSIGSYEDMGLSSVFSAILRAKHWDGPALRAFKHFLVKHIEFDDDIDAGHGALARTLMPDDTVTPLWEYFEMILCRAVPRIAAAGSRLG